MWNPSTAHRLSKMKDDELAIWHEKERKKDEKSSNCIQAEQEWQYRLMARQVKRMMWNMILSASLGAIISICGMLARDYVTASKIHTPASPLEGKLPPSTFPLKTSDLPSPPTPNETIV